MITDEALGKMFELAGAMPEAWRIRAEELIAAAEILADGSREVDLSTLKVGNPIPDNLRVLGPELLLRGLAVECLLKAVWVKQGHSLFADGKFKPIPGAGDHDLLQLATVVGLAFTEPERDVLKRLTTFVLFAGRYPVPKRASDARPESRPDGGSSIPMMWALGRDHDIYRNIVDKILKCLAS